VRQRRPEGEDIIPIYRQGFMQQTDNPKRENGNLGKALEVTYHQGDECCSYLYFPSPAG
jgi:hypothetical protein